MRSCRIITGGINEGKSTYIARLISSDIFPLGFVSDKDSDGYCLRDLESGESVRYLSKSERYDSTLGMWNFNPAVFDNVYRKLSKIENGSVYLDEIGRLELSGGGFDKSLKLLLSRDIDLTITVRDEFLYKVIERYGLHSAQIIRIKRCI